MEELEKETVKQTFEIVYKFINKIIPFEQLGGLLSDQIGYLRLKSLVNIIKKTEKLLNENNILSKDIKLKILWPLLNYSSLEEDENLQDKWATLLTNALDPDRSKYIKPIYVEILKDLTPIEVEILDSLYKKIIEIPVEEQKRATVYTGKEEIITEYNYLTEEELDIYIDNLIRLNICAYRPIQGFILGPHINNTISLTKLGISFIRSCKR